jgi:hypothetical protein
MAKVTRIHPRGPIRDKHGRFTREQQPPPVLHNPAEHPAAEISRVFRHFELGTYRELFRWFQQSGLREGSLREPS